MPALSISLSPNFPAYGIAVVAAKPRYNAKKTSEDETRMMSGCKITWYVKSKIPLRGLEDAGRLPSDCL